MYQSKKCVRVFSLALGSLMMLSASNSLNAFGWSKKDKKNSKKVVSNETTVESQQSIEIITAHKNYINTYKKTQDCFLIYQKASIEYKKANIASIKAYEEYQKSVALCSEASAKRDDAFERSNIDCDPEGKATQDWINASKIEQDLRLNAEDAYIKWINLNEQEKKAYIAREEAYNNYASALLDQKNAHIAWARVCAEDSSSK